MELRAVVCASPAAGQVLEVEVTLPAGSRVADALDAPCGLWGEAVPRDALLRDGDRVEVYRALTVDPKVARRERFVRQGARNAGLFARRRPGGKAGY